MIASQENSETHFSPARKAGAIAESFSNENMPRPSNSRLKVSVIHHDPAAGALAFGVLPSTGTMRGRKSYDGQATLGNHLAYAVSVSANNPLSSDRHVQRRTSFAGQKALEHHTRPARNRRAIVHAISKKSMRGGPNSSGHVNRDFQSDHAAAGRAIASPLPIRLVPSQLIPGQCTGENHSCFAGEGATDILIPNLDVPPQTIRDGLRLGENQKSSAVVGRAITISLPINAMPAHLICGQKPVVPHKLGAAEGGLS